MYTWVVERALARTIHPRTHYPPRCFGGPCGAHIYVCVYIHKYVYVHLYMIYMIYMHICIYMYAYVYMYIYVCGSSSELSLGPSTLAHITRLAASEDPAVRRFFSLYLEILIIIFDIESG